MRPFFTLLAAWLLSSTLFAQTPVTITMCAASQASSTSATGTIFDSGGPFNSYQNGEYCTLLINPGCAVNLSLTVHEFSVETCCDPLLVYDGDSESAPLLGDVRFATLPITYTPTSGKLFLRWSSDGSAVGPGFRATWTSTLVNPIAPVATVSVSNATPAFQETVQFEAASSNYPQIWAWNFGDGQTSLEQNPEHTYQTSGQYTAQLIVTNCHSLRDTVTQQITVQEPPAPVLNPTTLTLQSACADTARAAFTLYNEGAGDLLFSSRAESVLGRRNVLIYGYLATNSSLEGVQSVLANYPDMFEVFNTQASDNASLATALQGMDLLLVPELPSWLDPWGLMAQMPAIQAFIQNGGGVVVCGSYYYSHFLSATDLLLVENDNFYTTDYSYNGLPFITPHPIVQEMPLVYFSPYFTGALNVTDPEYTSLCTLNGLSVVGYKQVDAGRLVYLGFNFQSPDNDQRNLLKNALRWANLSSALTVLPNSGRVAPGDSIQVELVINTEEVVAGAYAGTVFFNVNHPVTPELTLPFNLNVSGQAIVQPQSSQLNFNDLMQLRTSQQQLVIKNPGCDTLRITDISVSNPAFTADKTVLTIDPFEEDTLVVTFAPIDTGLFQGNLVLLTEMGPTNVPVGGRGLGAPNVQITPPTLEATLPCGESTVLHLNVANTGLADLTLSRKFGGANSGGSRVLILDQLAYYSSIPYQISNQILAADPTAEVIHYNGSGTFSDLPNLLANSDMVVLPAIGSGLNEWYVTIGEYLQDYVSGGGFVLMTGTPNTIQLNLLGLVNVESNYFNTYAQKIIPLEQHPLLENVVFDDLVYDEAWSLNFIDATYVNIGRGDGAPLGTSLIGYQNIGNGTVAYIGYENEYIYPTANRLLINALEWGGTPGWFEVTNDSLVVAPGDSIELDVQIDANSIAAGVYQHNLLWATNDPLQPIVSIPVTITVEGVPELFVGASSLVYGIIQQFSQKTLKFEVANQGCDTLHILDFSSANPTFLAATNNPTVVLPFSSEEFSVVFAPLTQGSAVSVLTLTTDGGNATIMASGLAVGAPIVSATPASLEIDLGCDDVFSTQITLNNTGLGGLNYQIGQSPANNRIALFNVYASYWRLNAIQNQLTTLYPSIPLMNIPAVSASALADSLSKASILLIPSLETSESVYYAEYKPVIRSFLENGGLVFIVGVYYYQPLIQLGLFDQMDFYSQGYQAVEIIFPAHTIVNGSPSEFPLNENFVTAVFPQTEGVTTLARTKLDNHTYLGVKSRGLGQIVFWGNTFDNSQNAQVTTLFENMLLWSDNPLPPGVNMVDVSGNIPAGGEQQIELQVSSAGVPGGTHAGYVRVRSNDPQNPSYEIPIILNVSPEPCAAFNFAQQNCTKTVFFEDVTVNALGSWYWQFGDGSESFQQNPQHTYAVGGDYTVSMVGCNNFGCDTMVSIVAVADANGPVGISCTPQTLSYCCQAGVYEVHFNAINHLSSDGQSGYQNYSCTVGSLLVAGEQYPISIVTGPAYAEYVRVWIDYNNNGVFNANELVLADNAYQSHTGFVTIPGSAVKNTRLRMRVSSDANNIPTACSDVTNGQVEDYWVEIRTTIATNEPDSELKMSLFPNPSNGKVWLKLEQAQAETCLVQIHDAAGKLCWTDEMAPNGEAILLPALAQGAYFVKVQSEKAVKLERLIIVD